MGKSWPTPQMAFKASGIRSEKADCTDDKGRQCTDDKGRQQTRPNTPSPPPPPRHGHGAAQAWMGLTRIQCALRLTTKPPPRNAIACAAMLRMRTVLFCTPAARFQCRRRDWRRRRRRAWVQSPCPSTRCPRTPAPAAPPPAPPAATA